MLPSQSKKSFEEELAKQLRLVTVTKELTTSTVTDWTVNKSGKNNNKYSTSLKIQHKFVKLRFKLQTPAEVRNVKIGLNIARQESYMASGEVPYVQLYGYISESGKQKQVYLGSLRRMQDPGYTNYMVGVWYINLNQLAPGDYLSSIGSIHYASKISELEFVIGKPEYSVVDNISPYQNKKVSALQLAINFISIEGFNPESIGLRATFKGLVRKNMYRIIDSVFNARAFEQHFNEYFRALKTSDDEQLFGLIERQLDDIMLNFDLKMSKFLLILSEKNQRLSKSIFSFLLKNINKEPVFYGLIENILKKTHSYDFLAQFFSFGKSQLVQEETFGPKFLEVLSNYLTHLADHLDGQPFVLPLDSKFLSLLLLKYNKFPNNYFFEKFILITLYYLQEGRLHTQFDFDYSALQQLTIDSKLLT